MGGWMHVRVVDGHDVVGMETGRMRIGVVEHGVCEPKASVVRSTRMGKRMGRRGFMCCMGVWVCGRLVCQSQPDYQTASAQLPSDDDYT